MVGCKKDLKIQTEVVSSYFYGLSLLLKVFLFLSTYFFLKKSLSVIISPSPQLILAPILAVYFLCRLNKKLSFIVILTLFVLGYVMGTDLQSEYRNFLTFFHIRIRYFIADFYQFSFYSFGFLILKSFDDLQKKYRGRISFKKFPPLGKLLVKCYPKHLGWCRIVLLFDVCFSFLVVLPLFLSSLTYSIYMRSSEKFFISLCYLFMVVTCLSSRIIYRFWNKFYKKYGQEIFVKENGADFKIGCSVLQNNQSSRGRLSIKTFLYDTVLAFVVTNLLVIQTVDINNSNFYSLLIFQLFFLSLIISNFIFRKYALVSTIRDKTSIKNELGINAISSTKFSKLGLLSSLFIPYTLGSCAFISVMYLGNGFIQGSVSLIAFSISCLYCFISFVAFCRLIILRWCKLDELKKFVRQFELVDTDRYSTGNIIDKLVLKIYPRCRDWKHIMLFLDYTIILMVAFYEPRVYGSHSVIFAPSFSDPSFYRCHFITFLATFLLILYRGLYYSLERIYHWIKEGFVTEIV